MLQPWQTGMVIRIEQETYQTRRFWIQIPGLDRFDFVPGQFVTLDLPIHEKPNKRWRSYSIASWPDGSNIIELVIVFLEGGAGTTYLFNEVKVGSELTLRGPQGIFTLPQPIEKDLFFICTGTGIAPFRSMAHHMLENNIAHKEIYLIFGCRTLADSLYGPEMKELAGRMEGFHYIPTYSRETSADNLIRTGYVHTVYEEICRAGQSQSQSQGQSQSQNQSQGPGQIPGPGQVQAGNGSLPAANFFLCGWKNMIDEAKQRIVALGYDRKSIHQELYG